MSITKVDVIILAGGDGVVIDPNQRFKGLVPLAGKPMVEWVVEAFLSASLVNEVAVVLPTAENLGSWVKGIHKLVVSDGEFMDNVLAGVGAFRQDRPVVIATGDIPLITARAIDEFIVGSLETGADFVLPLVPERKVREAYPSSIRTYFRLRSGRFTNGNAILANPRLLARASELGQELFDHRKSMASTIRLAGAKFLVKFALGLLEPKDLSGKIQEVLGGTGAAIVMSDPTIAMDVDKPADLTLAENALLRQYPQRY